MAQNPVQNFRSLCGFHRQETAMELFCRNTELCRITEELVFTRSLSHCQLNRWTTPQLDDLALAFRHDGALKTVAQRLKLKFLNLR